MNDVAKMVFSEAGALVDDLEQIPRNESVVRERLKAALREIRLARQAFGDRPSKSWEPQVFEHESALGDILSRVPSECQIARQKLTSARSELHLARLALLEGR